MPSTALSWDGEDADVLLWYSCNKRRRIRDDPEEKLNSNSNVNIYFLISWRVFIPWIEAAKMKQLQSKIRDSYVNPTNIGTWRDSYSAM